MKKLIYVIVALLVLIAVAAIVVPIVLEEPITKAVKEETNKNLNATLDFSGVEISIIWSFPDLYVGLADLTIINNEPFAGDTLVSLSALALDVDLMSAFNGSPKVNSITLVDGKVDVKVMKDGAANYDITIPSEGALDTTATEASSGGFNLIVDHFGIENVAISYADEKGGLEFSTSALNVDLSGDLSADRTVINTNVLMEEVRLVSGKVAYLNNAELALDAGIDADLANSAYQLKENDFRINGLHLLFDGVVSMPNDDDVEMDLTFSAPQADFKEILSLIPAVYSKDFEDIKTTGTLTVDGYTKGVYNEGTIPGFNVDVNVANATFQYPDLPKSLSNIQVDLNVKNPGGDADLTLIDLSKLHVELAGNPFDMRAKVSSPVSDPNVDASFNGKIDLASLADAIPMGAGDQLTGTLISDFSVKARNSDIEKKRFSKVDAKGELIAMDIVYNSDSLPAPVSVKYGQFKFNPAYLELASFDGKIGESDLKASGRIDNYIGYVMSDDNLKGRFDISSTLMDLNMFVSDSEEPEEGGSGESSGEGSGEPSSGVIEIPKNLDVRLTSSFTKVLYDNLDITNVKGLIILKNGKADLSNLNMNVLSGSLALSGSYDSRDINDPKVDMNLDFKNVSLKEAYTKFESMKKIAPIAERTDGRASVNFNLKGKLGGDMEPIYNSLNGGGNLTSNSLKLVGAESFNKIGEVLKINALKDPEVKNVNLSFKFINGRVHVQPFDTKVGPVAANIFGSHGFDGTMDYVMATKVPTAILGAQVNALMGTLTSAVNGLGANVSVGDEIKVDLVITGTTDKPKITPRFGGSSGGGAGVDLKAQAAAELKKQQEALENLARDEAAKLQQQAEAELKKQQAELEKKAREEAARLQKEAEKKVEEEAGKLLNGLFGKPK
ncbi:MAG: hypothetical protein ACI85F_000144 [Bacteroidia bacterium]|jgi:uncharacterized protein involved in outer membrane biogenesis